MNNDHDLLRWMANSEESDPSVYPELYNISSRFIFQFLPRPAQPTTPEFLYVPYRSKKYLETIAIFAEWNLAWESAQLRHVGMFQRDQEKINNLIPALSTIENKNVYLLPDTPKRLEAYTAIYSLLPIDTLRRFDLPPLRRMMWPAFGASYRQEAETELPRDFRARLGRAFASHIWGALDSGSRISAFSKDDPLHILAHNLDFWLPHATKVIENRLSQMDFVDFEDKKEILKLKRIQSTMNPKDGVSVGRCRKGGTVWIGNDEASDATKELIRVANSEDRLRGLIDAIKSNRVEEDFSPRWSFAREDFERKLYSKRSRIRVKFVELDHAAAVVSAESEIHDAEIWNDFLAILDKKEKQIVVCLASGKTNLSEAASALGYSNHSSISKALKRIRHKVKLQMGI